MSVFRSGDPDEDFAKKDFEDYEWLKSRPVCNECLEGITDEYYYEIDGRNYCKDCLISYKVWIDE